MFIYATEKLNNRRTGVLLNGGIKWDRTETAAENFDGTINIVKVKCEECGLESSQSYSQNGAVKSWDKMISKEEKLRETIDNKSW